MTLNDYISQVVVLQSTSRACAKVRAGRVVQLFVFIAINLFTDCT